MNFFTTCIMISVRVQLIYRASTNSFITLISKVLSLKGANDYQPISLLNICLKLLTKPLIVFKI
jgi:hypothetical protein